MRVHILAKELNVTSKAVLEKCRAEGLGSVVKNHMSALGAGLEATIREWFSEGLHSTTIETAERIDLEKVRVKPAISVSAEGMGVALEEPPAVDTGEGDSVVVYQEAGTAVVEAPPAADETITEPAEPAELITEVEPEEEIRAKPVAEPSGPAEVVTEEIEPPAPPLREPVEAAGIEAAAVEAEPVEAQAAEAVAGEQDPSAATIVSAPATEEVETPSPPQPPEDIKPAGPQNVPAPARITGPRVVRYEAPEQGVRVPRPRPSARAPRQVGESGIAPPPSPPAPPTRRGPRDEPGIAKTKAKPPRSVQRDSETKEKLLEWRDQDLAERRARLKGATGRKIHRRRSDTPSTGTAAAEVARPKTTATVHEPVTVREFCSATGTNQLQVFTTLRREHDMLANINTELPSETAQLLALELSIELVVVPAKTALDLLEDEFASRKRADLQHRPPIVTMMGHVDHGKTSLLDTIRKTRVVAGEDGGITQHISSYHLKRDNVAVTFLDTPGHEAFTAMRARGANLTDIVVLVVAVDDGVMPQTVEAINHARAANTPIVVALNKTDLGRHDEMKVFGQLAEHDLAPVGWGGHTEVIGTSAVTGDGIDQLLETLTTLSELLELKADPGIPTTGTVIEAQTKRGVGAVVRVMVQEGRLGVGDVLVCGNSFGKVRALLDDQGKRIRAADPAMPVEVWGLDDVPLAGDRFYQVDNLRRAGEIAEEVKQARIVKARMGSQKVLSLDQIVKQRDAGEIPVLNVILRADVQGSVDALCHMLKDIPSDQVKLTILHSGVGAITDSDVELAATSNAIVVGFRVQAGTGSRRLAEEHGVDVRHYLVIYEVVNDIKKALEGLLEPEEHIEARAVVDVREVFRVSKVGHVAGCYVTSGTVSRNHLAKVIRDGVVVRDRAPLASLHHFKDDVKEVRAGLECGMMLGGFTDIHVGDKIETFEVVKVARTLD